MTPLIGVLSVSNIFGVALKLMGKTATKQNLVIAFSIVSGKHYCASTLRSELEAAIAAYYKVISEEQGEQDVEIEV